MKKRSVIMKRVFRAGALKNVSGADEARNIAEYYKQIIGKIEMQLGKDGYIETTEKI